MGEKDVVAAVLSSDEPGATASRKRPDLGVSERARRRPVKGSTVSGVKQRKFVTKL